MPTASHLRDHTTPLTTALLVERVRERLGVLSEPWVAPPPRARSAHPALRGIGAGAAGATIATLWVLVVDALRGLPFDTPATLAAHITYAFGSAGSRGVARLAPLYIGVEVVTFAAVGALAALVAHRMHGAWGMLGALTVTVVGVTLPLAALLALANAAALDDGVREQVVAAHVAAIAVMACLLWRTRPRSPRTSAPPAGRAASVPSSR